MSYDTVVERIQRGCKICDKDYLVADEDGWTVAHILASRMKFPADFPCWAVADEHGTTVAHQAAYYKKLPDDFDQWELADNHGTTVAQIAARNGLLTIDQTDKARYKKLLALTNKQGVTVADELKAYGQKQINKLKNILKSAKPRAVFNQ